MRNLLRCLLVLPFLSAPAVAADWPQFRGSNADGIADDQPLVATWNIKSKTNVQWKTPIPGMGHACPIVAGDRIFMVTAVGPKSGSLKIGLYGDFLSVKDNPPQQWMLICIDKRDGEELWRVPLRKGVPKVRRHAKSTHANSTPATDGQHVVVLLGSGDFYCFDVCGQLLWKKQLGVLDAGYFRVPKAQWGYGSSPVIYQGRVIVQCDIQKNSFLAAYDVQSGDLLWRTPRKDVPTWSSPTIFTANGRTEIVVNGYRHAGGYDLETGKELWRLVGGGDIPVPTPVVSQGLVVLSSAHGPLRPLLAIKGGAKGTIALGDAKKSQHVGWYNQRSGVYMPTPLIYQGLLYTCRINGLLSVYDFKTGKLQYRKRLGRGSTSFTSSPVAGDGKVYFAAEDGSVHVVQAGNKYKLLATNQMKEICMATPAISDGLLLVRTKGHLVAIGNPPPPPTRRRFRLLRMLLRR